MQRLNSGRHAFPVGDMDFSQGRGKLLQSIAGNAMSVPVIGACLLSVPRHDIVVLAVGFLSEDSQK